MPSAARLLAVAVVILVPLCAAGGEPTIPSPADRLLAPHGLEQFPELYRRALDAFLTAERLYENGDYERSMKVLDQLWTQYPPGSRQWASLKSEIAGVNVGSPPCYYALRMLTECARWRLRRQAQGPEQAGRRLATLTVVLVGRSKGIQPTSRAELERAGAGREAEHVLHPVLLEDNHRVVHQSLRLFCEYMLAATDGRLGVRTEVLHLPDLCVPVHAVAAPHRVAELAGGGMGRIWAAVPAKAAASTDWWWVLYPSHVPDQYPDFKTTEFITGGMGAGPDGVSPCFIIDDLWLVRKPPHLGQGTYTDEERRAYLPQWLQHEFAHHLFREYPQFGLEDKDHQWFDRRTWPKDFEGRFEADYFHEALHKRLQTQANPPLHAKLRYAPPPLELFQRLSLKSLCGTYRRQPVQNDWHVGTIQQDPGGDAEGKPVLRWRNAAGVSWRLSPDLEHGVLRTGPENPYFESNPESGRTFRLILRRDANGDPLPQVAGFSFQQELFAQEPQ